MAYVTYNNFKLGRKSISKYQSPIDGDTLVALEQLQIQCERREKNFYYSSIRGKKKGKAPENWKEMVKKEIAGPEVKSGLSVKKIGANAYLQAKSYDDFKTSLLQGFQKAYIGQLSLFDADEISKTLDHSIARLYKTLTTRLKNETIEITKTTISGPKSSTIEGWLIEIMQGALDHKKISTSVDKKFSVVADYVVPGIGLEETKRGLKSQDTILQSAFHVGSFTTTSMMEGKNWSELQTLLSEVFIEIMRDLTPDHTVKIDELREKVFDKLNLLIAGYLGARLTYGLDNKEIFYFGSGSSVLLGSEFIEGILVHSKLSSSGYAELSSKIGYTQLSRLGLDALLEELKGTSMQLGLDFSDRRFKNKIEAEIQKGGFKLGPFLKKGSFNLWYGKKTRRKKT